MRFNSEVDVREFLGLESWRNLSKDTFLQFLSAMPEIDREVALQLIGQIPEITTFAKVALDDAAAAYDGLLASNTRSMEMLHQIDSTILEALKDDLARELSPEERMHVLDAIRDVHSRSHTKDTENKKFLADQFDKRLGVAAVTAIAVAGIVFAASKSGGKAGVNVSRVLAA